jgi:hypothetical protein
MPIGPRKSMENGLRPVGDRSVEWRISFVCNKGLAPRVGYVEKKQLLALVISFG